MALRNPVAIYNAANNLEAYQVKLCLVAAGIEAVVVEDHSLAGIWMFGTIPEIHKPQVWVDQADVDRARAVLRQFKADVSERQRASRQRASEIGPTIEVLCEECGKTSLFPPVQQGTVQDCPACGAFVDVEEVDPQDAFWLEPDEPRDS